MRSSRIAYWTLRAKPKPSRSSVDRLGERGQVAAQLLQRVHPVRHPPADHERVERQVAVAVGAVVDEVPQRVGLLGDAPRRRRARRRRAAARGAGCAPRRCDVRRKRSASRSQKIAPKWCAGRPGDRDRLGEQRRALAVVAGRVVDERDRDELRVVVALGLERGEPDGHGTRTISASSAVSREPFCLYIGNTTRCSMPS